MKALWGMRLAVSCAALLGVLTPSALRADELVTNGNFSGGVYSDGINPNVPNGWTSNMGFDYNTSWDRVINLGGGNYEVSIGNDDGNPVPALSQVITDVSGASYTGFVEVNYGGAGTGDTLPFFDLLIDGTTEVALNYKASGSNTIYDFSFTGTGSDTLTIEGNTSPSEWYVPEVSVSTANVSPTPEPSSLLLLGSGLAGFAGMVRRKLAR